ncbi:Cutinase [Cytospora mali]|uniref:Cutinase n=1 Tax=Cytospora mali TaxID=578113 RepID=A0A194URG7_CYTMA|nr:Cutinase [Valsa mali var. pyri (nom. inval.)]
MKPTSFLSALALGANGLTLPESSFQTLRPRLNINDLLALISELFPVNVTLEAAQDLISTADQALADAEGFETTRNDLKDGVCGDVLVIFARGTDEPGNVGALVGPPFFDAIEDALGSGYTLAVQGVDDYDATVTEYLEGGDPEGSQEMASLVTQAFTDCPSSKIVMGGYSQGGQIVHNAASLLPAATMEAVSSVVIFGDPDSTKSVDNAETSRVLIICHTDDYICQDGDIIDLEHLTYAENAATAASFVVSNAGL